MGLGAGPFFVGLLNDSLVGEFGAQAIRYSLLAVSLMGLVAGLLFWCASRTLLDDLAARDGRGVSPQSSRR